MVKVTHTCFLVFAFVHGALSRAQESGTPTTGAPRVVVQNEYTDYNAYGDYGKQYGDYGKQYGDYVKQYNDYVKMYGDYGAQYGDYISSTAAYTDYGEYEHAWHYEDEYAYYDDDYTTDYGEYFVFGDRNNPLDTITHIYEETALQSNMPWVYIIVPVVQIDVLYVDPEHEMVEDVEMQFPIETFFFELGDFGMGHFDLNNFDLGNFGLGDFGLGDFGLGDYGHGDYGHGDYRHAGEYEDISDYGPAAEYGDYNDYPVYGHYQGEKANLFDTADELGDLETLDYPGIDHDPYWIDWIFMVPPEQMAPDVIQ